MENLVRGLARVGTVGPPSRDSRDPRRRWLETMNDYSVQQSVVFLHPKSLQFTFRQLIFFE